MTRSEFLAELQEMLQLDEPLTETTDLLALEEWDSLAFMVLIAFFDKHFGIRLTFEDLAPCATPQEVIDLARGAIA